ncbi:MAG TPA: PepSY-associated TM helix domain-containing protein [Steroidobacteraceae bacterium]
MRKVLFQMHLWMGMGIGLYILMISVSGSLIIFRRELDRALCPRIIMVPKTGRPLTDAELQAKARAAYPDADFKQVEIHRSRVPGAAVEVWLLGGSLRLERLFDPYTGANLNDTVACEPRSVTWLADLHDNLTRGRSGLRVNGVGALAILLLSTSGLVLWWPRRARWRHSLMVHRNVGGRRFIRELHGVLGFWCFALILLWGITGIYFAFPAPFIALLDVFSVQGADTAASRFLEDAFAWLVRVHFGRSFGRGIEVTWAILALVPCTLVITGVVMWWHRVARAAPSREGPG